MSSPGPEGGAGLRVAAAPTAIAVVALDGQLLNANRAWVARFGKAEGALEMRVAPEGRAALAQAIAALDASGAAERVLPLLQVDGTSAQVDCELSLDAERRVFYLAAHSQAPARRALDEAHERAHRSEQELRKLIDHVPDGIVVMHSSKFVYANAAAARILGYDSPQQLIGVHFSAIVRPDELPESVQRVRQMGSGALPPRNQRPMVRRDGTTVVAETLGFPTVFDGQPATLVIAHDVTDAQRMLAQVRQSDRLASLGLLAAGVAHELNNPLAYVLLNLGQIRKWLVALIDDRAAPQLTDSLKLVEQSLEGADHMRVILGELRAFSRVDDREKVLLDVREVMESSISMANHHIARRAQLVREYGEVPRVRANEARLGQVFLNLLVNAAQAILQKGEVRVKLAAGPNDTVVISVSDTGVGMAPEVLAKIFDPFFTTKPADLGTGLGLSVCQGIVEGLGGTIVAHSEPQKGSTFTVTLPAATEPDEARATPPRPALTRARVLIVDDEPRIARHLAELLEGHDVVVVTSGADAVARLGEERFDVVFCDLMMPKVSGVQVFEQGSRRNPAMASRFIFMTAGAFTPEARAFLDHVPNPRLDKPFEPSQVLKLFDLLISQAF
ncbi:MAG: PAS domain S-box protein [Archangiaceae bacterium]|nr:PAS domain S-box protein [Archangiaceae bacterium]